MMLTTQERNRCFGELSFDAHSTDMLIGAEYCAEHGLWEEAFKRAVIGVGKSTKLEGVYSVKVKNHEFFYNSNHNIFGIKFDGKLVHSEESNGERWAGCNGTHILVIPYDSLFEKWYAMILKSRL